MAAYSRVKQVILHGSYFGYNYGDTLLCALFCRWIKQADAQAQVHLPLADEVNRQAIGADSAGWFNKPLADVSIFCGGGYFGERKAGQQWWAVRCYFRHIRVARWLRQCGIPLHILGVGAGPISAGWLKVQIVELFKLARSVVVRDEESFRFLQESGFERADVSTDAALSLTAADIPQVALDWCGRILRDVQGKKLILLHFTKRHSQAFDVVLPEVEALLAADENVHVFAVTDSKPRWGRTIEHQLTARAVKAALGRRCTLWEYDGQPWHLTALLTAMDVIVTTKLHVGIVGTALRKFVVSLPEHQKTPRFYKQIGLSERCLMGDKVLPEVARELLADGLAGEETDFAGVDKVVAEMDYKARIERILLAA